MSQKSKLLWLVLTALMYLESLARADVVTEWNALLLGSLRAENAAPTSGSRTLAIVHAAIYDAVNSIVRSHEPYHVQLSAASGAVPEAAALAAAYQTMTVLCPTRKALFDSAYQTTLGSLPAGPGLDEGLRIGQEVALQILDWRSTDGSTTDIPYIPSDLPGAWRRTPPDFRPPLDPHWGFVLPFALPATTNFPVPPPPRLDSPEYAAAFRQVKELGARVTQVRTADQTQVGLFWAYDRGGMGPPLILYNQIVQVVADQQGNSLAENARLFALINLAQADAAIICWGAKYQYNFWRPITAIRAGDTDGNAGTEADAAWEPLGAPGSGVRPDFTPPFPSYPSGHGTFGAAVFRILRQFYGRDDISFVAGSEELPGVTRAYQRFSQADEENALSRVYLGVHWIFDQRRGQASGRAVADYVFNNLLRPVSAEPRFGLPLRLPNGGCATHFSAPAGPGWIIETSEDLRSWSELVRVTGPFTFIDAPGARSTGFYTAVRQN